MFAQIRTDIFILILKKSVNLHHHTLHFFSGFMLLPFGQLKSFAKSSLLLIRPMFLNSPGEWVSARILIFSISSLNLSQSDCKRKILLEYKPFQWLIRLLQNRLSELLVLQLSKIIVYLYRNVLVILCLYHVLFPWYL